MSQSAQVVVSKQHICRGLTTEIIFSTVLGLEVQGQGAVRSGSGDGSFLIYRWPPSHFFLTWRVSRLKRTLKA